MNFHDAPVSQKTQPSQTSSSGLEVQINSKNRSFKREKTYTKRKTANLVLLSLFMRTHGKCNHSHAP